MTDSNGGIDVILDYGVPQVLVAHVSDSDVGTVSSVDSAIRSIDGEINKTTERRDFLMRKLSRSPSAPMSRGNMLNGSSLSPGG